MEEEDDSPFRASTSQSIKAKPLTELITFVEKAAQRMEFKLRENNKKGTLSRSVGKRTSQRIAQRRRSIVKAAKEELARHRASSKSSVEEDSKRSSFSRLRNEDVWAAIGNFFRRKAAPSKQEQQSKSKRSEVAGEEDDEEEDDGKEKQQWLGNMRRAATSYELGSPQSSESEDGGPISSPKYATLRPSKKIDDIKTRDHAGAIQLSSYIYVQGSRINSWHKCWFNLWYTGIELYTSKEACDAVEDSFQDIFFEDLVLPTGKVVDVLPRKNWGLRNRFPFCLNTEDQTFVFAADSKDLLSEYVEAFDIAYAEFIERQIRRKVMMQIAWSLSEDPGKFMEAQLQAARMSEARGSKRMSRIGGRRRGGLPQLPVVDEHRAKSVLQEMLDALEERFLTEVDRILARRRLYKAFLGWKAVKMYRDLHVR